MNNTTTKFEFASDCSKGVYMI